ncbi:hypothetical protein SeLEV6574_g07934, partial [Synchytrium endobioticum]
MLPSSSTADPFTDVTEALQVYRRDESVQSYLLPEDDPSGDERNIKTILDKTLNIVKPFKTNIKRWTVGALGYIGYYITLEEEDQCQHVAEVVFQVSEKVGKVLARRLSGRSRNSPDVNIDIPDDVTEISSPSSENDDHIAPTTNPLAAASEYESMIALKGVKPEILNIVMRLYNIPSNEASTGDTADISDGVDSSPVPDIMPTIPPSSSDHMKRVGIFKEPSAKSESFVIKSMEDITSKGRIQGRIADGVKALAASSKEDRITKTSKVKSTDEVRLIGSSMPSRRLAEVAAWAHSIARNNLEELQLQQAEEAMQRGADIIQWLRSRSSSKRQEQRGGSRSPVMRSTHSRTQQHEQGGASLPPRPESHRDATKMKSYEKVCDDSTTSMQNAQKP